MTSMALYKIINHTVNNTYDLAYTKYPIRDELIFSIRKKTGWYDMSDIPVPCSTIYTKKVFGL